MGEDANQPSSPDSESAPPAFSVGEAMETHRESAAAALARGEPAEIKRLYVEFGDLLESAIGQDIATIPVLSYPENAAAVSSAMSTVSGKILDAGCGPNPASAMLLASQDGNSVVLLDIGIGMVRLARARAAAEGLALPGIVADVEALPFLAGVFAGITCDDTIEHLPDDRRAVDELARVLRSDGLCVIATPNRRRLDVLVRRGRDRARRRRRSDSDYFAASSHLREYTFSDLGRTVSHRFRVVRAFTVGWSGRWPWRVASVLVKRRPFRSLGKMVILLLARRDD